MHTHCVRTICSEPSDLNTASPGNVSIGRLRLDGCERQQLLAHSAIQRRSEIHSGTLQAPAAPRDQQTHMGTAVLRMYLG